MRLAKVHRSVAFYSEIKKEASQRKGLFAVIRFVRLLYADKIVIYIFSPPFFISHHRDGGRARNGRKRKSSHAKHKSDLIPTFFFLLRSDEVNSRRKFFSKVDAIFSHVLTDRKRAERENRRKKRTGSEGKVDKI